MSHLECGYLAKLSDRDLEWLGDKAERLADRSPVLAATIHDGLETESLRRHAIRTDQPVPEARPLLVDQLAHADGPDLVDVLQAGLIAYHVADGSPAVRNILFRVLAHTAALIRSKFKQTSPVNVQ